MKFKEKLIRGRIAANYKNTILDVEFEDGVVRPVFCYDYDNQNLLYNEGTEVWVSEEQNPKRRIRYEVQLVRNAGGVIFVNPNYNEELFMEAFKKDMIDELKDYTSIRKIARGDGLKYAHFEFGSEKSKSKLYVYVAHIYRKEGRYVVFPSNINLLEMKVLDEFEGLRAKGHKTAIFFVVPRSDTLEVRFVWSLNQTGAARIYDQAKNGLKFICYGCNVSAEGVEIDKKMDIKY